MFAMAFKCFLCVLQVFQTYVVSVSDVCCKCLAVSDIYCKCFRHMLPHVKGSRCPRGGELSFSKINCKN
jgi:hypothetical protein